MSKLTDFYKKAATDPALKADLEAAKKRFAGQNPDKAAIVAEGIAIAAKHGVTLEAADFELDAEELSAVAGGFPIAAIIPYMPQIADANKGQMEGQNARIRC
ncbi:hypothetical protein AGMMS49928_23440 [Spirochaetia bacterium]|nr:hypothetical protein AGMMS49928_23440 [Spirochaetia bacterium]